MTTISDERLAEIEAALGEDTFAGITRTFEIKVPELRAIIQSLRAQGGLRVKPYVKRNAPGHDGDGGKVVVPFETDAEMRRILSSLEASPAPASYDDAMEDIFAAREEDEILDRHSEASPAPVSDNVFAKGAPEDVAVMPVSDGTTQVSLRTAFEIEQERLASKASPAPVSEELVERIENAKQAMSETHSSWESRCHAIMAALGIDYGRLADFLPDDDRGMAKEPHP